MGNSGPGGNARSKCVPGADCQSPPNGPGNERGAAGMLTVTSQAFRVCKRAEGHVYWNEDGAKALLRLLEAVALEDFCPSCAKKFATALIPRKNGVMRASSLECD
jgi:hypothetical protein